MNIKAFFPVAVFSLLAATLAAQTTYQMGFTFGSNYSSLRSDLFTTSSGRIGAAAGCSFVLGFGEHFELNQEIVYVTKGASAKVVNFMPEQGVSEGTMKYYSHSFEASLLGGYQPITTVPIRLQAGAFMGTHFHNMDGVNRELYVGDYENVNTAIPAHSLVDAFSGVDAGPVLGVSAGSGRFRANAR